MRRMKREKRMRMRRRERKRRTLHLKDRIHLQTDEENMRKRMK